ncbi:MAG: hypothetical protein JNK34_11215 [Tabrizicola sp.]|nr:hypothetical protein [Tabrizicola sp.]
MNTLVTAILVAFLRTTNEGGSVAIPYPDTQACEAAGAELEAEIEAITLGQGGHPKVIWTCIPG